MKGKRVKLKKLNNSGAALVTVLVVVTFISVLVTIMMYMAGMNYFMKTTDKRIKDSFYEAEIGMENIKAGLMKEAALAFKEAYAETAVSFVPLGDGGNRTDVYNQTFVDTLDKLFNGDPGDSVHYPGYISPTSGQTLLQYLQSKAGSAYGPNITEDPANPIVLEFHHAEGYMLIKNVKMVYVKDTYETVISTDFVVKAPGISWDVDAAETNWDSSDDADPVGALTRKEYSMADCVLYQNWRKE